MQNVNCGWIRLYNYNGCCPQKVNEKNGVVADIGPNVENVVSWSHLCCNYRKFLQLVKFAAAVVRLDNVVLIRNEKAYGAAAICASHHLSVNAPQFLLVQAQPPYQ